MEFKNGEIDWGLVTNYDMNTPQVNIGVIQDISLRKQTDRFNNCAAAAEDADRLKRVFS
jgi:hypothetical protein